MNQASENLTRERSRTAELSCAVDAARAAGAAILTHYGTAEAELKAGGSPVTAADHAASAVIVGRIRAAFPNDAILCEETADDPSRLAASRVWVVDPLDGTKEFLAGNGEFSVMIGLVEDGVPVAGVVYLPAPDRLYAAASGEGAWVEADSQRRALRAGGPEGRLRLVTSRSHADAAVEAMCAALDVTDRRPCGSVGIKCALIAEGECDLYAHPVPYMGEWDTCAPEVLLREAGGTVVDCRGESLQYNKRVPLQPWGILACGPGLMQRVLPTVRDALDARTA